MLAFAGLGGFLFLNTLYLQNVRDLSPLAAGLYLLPMAAMILVFAPVSGHIVGSRGTRPPLLLASAALVVGSLMLTQLSPDTAAMYLLGSYVLFGVGNGLVNVPITETAVTGMPQAQAGVASAVASTSRQVGMTLGVAVIGAVAGGSIGTSIGRGFASASHSGWWIIGGLGADDRVRRGRHHRQVGETNPREGRRCRSVQPVLRREVARAQPLPGKLAPGQALRMSSYVTKRRPSPMVLVPTRRTAFFSLV